MSNCQLRFFDDFQGATEKDIVISNIMLSRNIVVTKTYGSTYGTLPTPSRTGYAFAGWYNAPTGGTQVTESTQITGNTTWYARWTNNTTYHWRALCACYGNSTFSRWITGGGGSTNPSDATWQCMNSTGASTCSRFCQNNQGSYQGISSCTAEAD